MARKDDWSFALIVVSFYCAVSACSIAASDKNEWGKELFLVVLILTSCASFYAFLKIVTRDKISLSSNVDKGFIPITEGWSLVRDDDKSSHFYGEWFLQNPSDVLVARFWDGAEAGSIDAKAFANSLRLSGLDTVGDKP